MTIGDNIRRIREHNGTTQEELAALLGVSQRTISSWETGRTEPKIAKIEALSRALNCESADIVEDPSCAGQASPAEPGTGENIRKRRLELGMTQEELANKIGVQKSAVAKYESGRVKNIKRTTIFSLAKTLRCDPAWLMNLKAESSIENEIMQAMLKLTEENKIMLLKQAKFLLHEQSETDKA